MRVVEICDRCYMEVEADFICDKCSGIHESEATFHTDAEFDYENICMNCCRCATENIE